MIAIAAQFTNLLFRYRIILLVIAMCSNIGFSQEIVGRIFSDNGDVLVGASVFNSKTKTGVVSDFEGKFKIELLKGNNEIVLSYVGFKGVVININSKNNEIRDIGEVILHNDGLDEVLITGTLRQVSKLESPVPVELYTAQFFRANPTTSVFEAIESINGIRPQLNCSVCNTGDIHINGQEGANTMVLIDGLPIVSGLSTVYGLTGIPQSMIEQVEVIKGPASTIYGSEAIGGVINLITKLPANSDKFNVESFVSSWGEINLDIGSKYKIGNNDNLLGVNYFTYTNPIDNNGDGFTDITIQNRISIFNKFNGKKNKLGVRFFYEDRWGGEIDWMPQYRGGTDIYGENIFTTRYEVFGKYDMTDNLYLQYSFNNHNQDSVYGDTEYIATQTIGFFQGIFTNTIKNHLYLFGLTYRYTLYNDNTPATLKSDITHLPGVFFQDEITLSKSSTFLLGLRYDQNSRYGSIWTPRLNYKWTNQNKTSVLRFSFGNGYRVVNVFTEDHAALTGARDIIFEEDILPEKSWNVNVNWNKKIYSKYGYILDIDLSAFRTVFSNRILPDYDTNPNQIIYSNLDGQSITQGFTVNFTGTFPNGLRTQFGATYIDSYIEENNIKVRPYLTERFSANYKIGYSIIDYNLTFDLTGSVIGPMRLPLLGDLDPRPPKSPIINIMNFQFTYKMLDVEIYGGLKNIFNFTPDKNSITRAFDPFDKEVDFDDQGNAIATNSNPNALTFDTNYVYYSNQGRRTFVGLRYKFN